MTDTSLAGACEVGDRLSREISDRVTASGRDPIRTAELVRSLTRARRRFGISRLGSLTRLDRAGICVTQVVRPLALSNAVCQGKGLTVIDAAASALMETLELWAAERIPAARVKVACARDLGAEVRDLYPGCLVHAFDAGWDQLPLGWIDAYDLFRARTFAVPMALVDTNYTLPSPHPVAFPRATTGLAAERTLLGAVLHAALEVLERASVALSQRRPLSLPERRVHPPSASGPLSSMILARLRAAGLITGIWLVPTEHGLPAFRCHVIEGEDHREVAPMPGVGYGCDFTRDRALAKALLEAAQARVTAISGAREDITRAAYPARYDRELLADWRAELSSPSGCIALDGDCEPPSSAAAALDVVLRALEAAGARAALVVPLFSDDDLSIEVVRLVAPPLRTVRR
jgi:ribosomal protein S12 methylthiotransferase accessory factor